MKNLLVFVLSSIFLVGCSSAVVKVDSSSPLKKGLTQYSIDKPIVNLTLGQGAIEGDTTFADQGKLESQFAAALSKHFSELKQLAASPDVAEASVAVTVDYQRNFNWGGKSLNKPHYSYTVLIKNEGQVLAQYSVKGQTTRYGGLEDAAVNMQISAFTWDAEDEPKDIDLISKLIATEVSAIGN